MLKVIVLGAAAGGALPQWNCRCAVCAEAWTRPEMHDTQVSLAVSADDGQHWFLINASPDIRAQILTTPQLHPREGHLRHSPIAGVFLTNGEIDAITGLLSLREGQPFGLYGHRRVLETLASNSVFNVLNPERVPRHEITLGEVFEPALPDGSPSGLLVEAFTVPGKPAWYLEGTPEGEGHSVGDTIGLTLSDRATGKRAHVILACAAMSPALEARLTGADLVFFDGTLWRDDEMIRAGLAQKTGAGMGHVSMSGQTGSMALLRGLGITRKVFVHINNSNPVWLEDSPERASVEAEGWIIPRKGQEFTA